jgi:hypothetical protein
MIISRQKQDFRNIKNQCLRSYKRIKTKINMPTNEMTLVITHTSSLAKLTSMRDNLENEYSALNGKFLYRLSSIYKLLDKHLIKTKN